MKFVKTKFKTTKTKLTPVDTLFSNVSLLLPMNGSNGSTTFTDSSLIPKTGVATNAQISTADFKFGGSSGYFNGSSYVTFPSSAAFQFGAGDYSIECWVKPTGVTAEQHIIAVQFSGAGWDSISVSFHFFIIGSNLYFRSFSGGTPLTLSPIGSISAGVWSHIYAGRSGNRLYGAINGTIMSIDCTGHTQNNTVQNLVIGRHGDYTGGLYYTGYIDDVRITKGIGRYTANFTPPTQSFPVR